jgi:death-on-curing protein
LVNGYTFEYGDEVRALLHRFATDEATVDTETTTGSSRHRWSSAFDVESATATTTGW